MTRSAQAIITWLAGKKKHQALVLLLGISFPAYMQTLAKFEVTVDRAPAGIEIPLRVMLDAVTHLPDSTLDLVEVQGNKRMSVPFQLEAGRDRMITWLMMDDRKVRRYELVNNPRKKSNPPAITARKHDGGLMLAAGDRNLLRYQYETLYPPPGIDPVFRRSAFVHPLWSPHGQVLTRIQPPDHYHHYGLWNPWTHVHFEGDTIDFWNLRAKQGTVQFGSFVSSISGSIFGEYSASHEHIAYPGQAGEKIALRELQTVRVYAPQRDADYYLADIAITLNCAGSPVRLLEYRYGGLGWRATEQWTKENTRVLTSEGKTRKDADGSKARWCIVEGEVDGENAGIVMMSYPANYNHPEPLRIWPENANGNRGDMFANFSPTKDTDWSLDPGRNYTLNYRLVVFNGTFTKEKAEAAWQDFAHPPHITVVKNGR